MPIHPLNRRTFLRGAGITLALPFLEAMLPINRSWAATNSRFATLYKGNGMLSGRDSSDEDYWSCAGNLSGITTLSAPMQSLAAFKDYLTVVQNVSFAALYPSGDAGHEQAAPSFLTGLSVQNSSGQLPSQGGNAGNVMRLSANGSSLDRLIAAKTSTPLKSLMMSIGKSNRTDAFVARFAAPQLMSNLSWEGQSTHFDEQTVRSPADAYQRLISSGLATSTTAPPADNTAQTLLAQKKSVIDAVKSDLSGLMSKLGAADKQVMNEYVNSLKQIEADLQVAPTPMTPQAVCSPPTATKISEYKGNADVQYNTITKSAQQMMEIMALAFQCGVTEVSTLMLSYDWSTVPGAQLNAAYGAVNVGQYSLHNASHYRSDGKDTSGVEAMRGLERWHSAQVAYLAKLLKGMADSDGRTILDNTAILFGAGMGDPDLHSFNHMFRVIVGRGAGLNPGANGKVIDAGSAGNNGHAKLLQSLAGGFGITSTIGMSGGGKISGVVG